MLREFLIALVRPIYYLIFRIRFNSIWELKKYLIDNKKYSGGLASVYNKYFYDKGSYVGITSNFLGTPYFPHGVMGVFIADTATIGKNAVIFQQVTIGADRLVDSKEDGSPIIGDNAYIGVGAKIIGNVHVGNNCRIGANAVVYQDMNDNCVAVCEKTRIIQKKNLDNRFVYVDKKGKKKVYENGRFKDLE